MKYIQFGNFFQAEAFLLLFLTLFPNAFVGKKGEVGSENTNNTKEYGPSLAFFITQFKARVSPRVLTIIMRQKVSAVSNSRVNNVPFLTGSR